MSDAARSRRDGPDLLVRQPVTSASDAHEWVDPVAQARTLASLVERGMLSLEDYERQRRLLLRG